MAAAVCSPTTVHCMEGCKDWTGVFSRPFIVRRPRTTVTRYRRGSSRTTRRCSNTVDPDLLTQGCTMLYETAPWSLIPKRVQRDIRYMLQIVNDKRPLPWFTKHPIHEVMQHVRPRAKTCKPTHSSLRNRRCWYTVRSSDLFVCAYFAGVSFWKALTTDAKAPQYYSSLPTEWRRLLKAVEPRAVWDQLNRWVQHITVNTEGLHLTTQALSSMPGDDFRYVRVFYVNKLERGSVNLCTPERINEPCSQLLIFSICTGMLLLQSSLQGNSWNALPPRFHWKPECLPQDQRTAVYGKMPECSWLPWYKVHCEAQLLLAMIVAHDGYHAFTEMLVVQSSTQDGLQIRIQTLRKSIKELHEQCYFRMSDSLVPTTKPNGMVCQHNCNQKDCACRCTSLQRTARTSIFNSVSRHLGLPCWPKLPAVATSQALSKKRKVDSTTDSFQQFEETQPQPIKKRNLHVSSIF